MCFGMIHRARDVPPAARRRQPAAATWKMPDFRRNWLLAQAFTSWVAIDSVAIADDQPAVK
jgi:hypothetical protein